MSKLKSWGRVAWAWVDERLGLQPAVDMVAEKTVPEHRHTFWYYWGGLCLFFFVIQVVTGLLLMVYYEPGENAYASVAKITNEINYGWLIRSIHSWSANLMLGAVFIHMFSVYFFRAYRKPREFGWWTGLGLLGAAMLFGFSGYLLPMDELAYFATRVGLAVPEIMPGAGPLITAIARGGTDVGAATVQRFFVLHVMLLPMVFMALLGLHLWLIQKHGNKLPPGEEEKPVSEQRSVKFVPNFMLRDAAAWLVALMLLVGLACFFPWKLGPPADPLAAAPEGIHPEWYFMSQFIVLKLLGKVLPGVIGEYLGVAIFTLGGVFWGLIPLLDPESAGGRRARLFTWIGLLAVIGFLFLTVLAYWLP